VFLGGEFLGESDGGLARERRRCGVPEHGRWSQRAFADASGDEERRFHDGRDADAARSAQESDGGAGFRIGIRSELNEHRSNCFVQKGINAGWQGDQLVLGPKTRR
jgi:hypothetical protein